MERCVIDSSEFTANRLQMWRKTGFRRTRAMARRRNLRTTPFIRAIFSVNIIYRWDRRRRAVADRQVSKNTYYFPISRLRARYI